MYISSIFVYTQIITSFGFLHLFGNGNEENLAVPFPNNEKPLILTPLIESGKIKQAQDASRVQFEDFKDQNSYSGFFTVNKAFDSNMYFWYFPCQKHPESAPVLLWLQGGPGASSLYGLFMENGPFIITNNQRIEIRNSSWTKTHNVIYIDNPVGTGFSFTNQGYADNETAVAKDLYEALQQFFKLFPNLQKNEFYVSGESYAGKYVPAISYMIHQRNPSSDLKINLKGLAIGNGLSDPEHQLNFADYFYQIGMVDQHGREILHRQVSPVVNYIKSKEWIHAVNAYFALYRTYKSTIGFTNIYNYLNPRIPPLGPQEFYVNQSKVRKALHVGDTPYNGINQIRTVYNHLMADWMKSVVPLVSELLNHYRVMTYNGQLDMCVAYPLTENYLRHLNFSSADEYKVAKRQQWRVQGRLAGFVKLAGNLTEVMVRNAGHMVPQDQPEWALDMITRFTHHKEFQ